MNTPAATHPARLTIDDLERAEGLLTALFAPPAGYKLVPKK